MAVVTWMSFVEHHDEIPRYVNGYGRDRYSAQQVRLWRAEALDQLERMADGRQAVALDTCHHGLLDEADGRPARRWAIACDGNVITVCWRTGPRSYAWVDAAVILGTQTTERLLDQARTRR